MRAGRHDADFAHSLTDLMSGVAVMFLVVAAIFMVQASRAKRRAEHEAAQSEQIARENKELAKKNAIAAKKFKEIDDRDRQGILEIEALFNRLNGKPGIELRYDPKKDPRLLTVVFDRDTLNFASGECEVAGATRDAMHATLKRIFPEICSTVGESSAGLQKSITLEGHTDNEPPLSGRCSGVALASACGAGHERDPACVTQGFEGNVQLSAARAQYVFFEARKMLKDNADVASCLDRNFMVAGRGPMEPMDGGPWDRRRTPAENDKNRRVVIKVRVVAAVERGAL